MARAPEIAEEDMNVMFATNVTGLVNMTQAVMPIFLARPDGGHGDIINIGSGAGHHPYAGGGIYCATKAAMRSFSESLRMELVSSRIRVIEIDPGQVETVSCARDVAAVTRNHVALLADAQNRSFLSSATTAIRPRPMLSMRMYLVPVPYLAPMHSSLVSTLSANKTEMSSRLRLMTLRTLLSMPPAAARTLSFPTPWYIRVTRPATAPFTGSRRELGTRYV